MYSGSFVDKWHIGTFHHQVTRIPSCSGAGTAPVHAFSARRRAVQKECLEELQWNCSSGFGRATQGSSIKWQCCGTQETIFSHLLAGLEGSPKKPFGAPVFQKIRQTAVWSVRPAIHFQARAGKARSRHSRHLILLPSAFPGGQCLASDYAQKVASFSESGVPVPFPSAPLPHAACIPWHPATSRTTRR